MINQCLVVMATCEDAADIFWRLCFQYTECKICRRLPTHLQPMARSRESTCACAAVTPSKAQAVRRLSGWNFLYAQYSFFLEHSHSCVWQKPFIFTYIEFSFFSATIFLCMWRWITEIECKHVIFWISAFQTVARWVKVKTLLHHWKLWFWNKTTGLFLN